MIRLFSASLISLILVVCYTEGAQAQNSNTSGSNETALNSSGSVKVSPTISEAILTQAKISLGEAASAAEQAIGNNSHATSVSLGVENGFLIYRATVMDSQYVAHKVIIDAGNGNVLLRE